MTADRNMRQRNRRKRFAGWTLFYAVVFAVFLLVIFWQARRVNTLEFPRGQLELTTSKTKYTAGDTVTYTIKNGLSTSVKLVSRCPQEPLHVYQWKNNQWARIHDTAKSSVCNGQPNQTVVQSGGSFTGNYKNWSSLFAKPGIYRLVALANNYTALPYADFQVVAKPKPAIPQIIYKPVYTPVYTPVYIPAPSGGGGDGGGGGDN